MRIIAIFVAAAVAAALPIEAFAHCPISYVLTGPGGLAWQINLGGVTADGELPGGTTSQLGPMTSWTDTRREGQVTGPLVVSQVFTDGVNYTVCPPVTLNLSGPPQCSEDGQVGAVPHPLCIVYFTVVQSAPGVYTCSSTCLPGTMPTTQYYFPPHSAAATLSSISPASASAGSPAVAVSVSGSGFGGSTYVQWNGAPLATTYVSASQVLALVPSSLLASPGTASVTVVAAPGSGPSAAASFTTAP